MTGRDQARLLRLALGLVVVELLAVFFFMIVRAEYLVAGVLAIAGFYLVLVAGWEWGRAHGGLAWPFTYLPTLAREPAQPRREAEFALLTGRVDSYLSNVSRPDEVHPVIVEIVRQRLLARHGIALEDTGRATLLLGAELARYVYEPPRRSAQGRTPQRLNALLTRIEEL